MPWLARASPRVWHRYAWGDPEEGDVQAEAPNTTSPSGGLRRLMWVVNALGGVAVLGSYAWGIWTQPDPGRLWGRIPESVQGPYSACMPLAALGYFALLAWAHHHVDRVLVGVMTVMLVCSALWMPLSFLALEQPAWLPVVQFVLAGTALAALTLLIRVRKSPPGRLRLAASLGMVAFCLQTVVLDCLVWPRFFG